MKKLLYLLFAVTLIGCSESPIEENNKNNIEIPTPTITFTLRPSWKKKLIYNTENTTYYSTAYFETACGEVLPIIRPEFDEELNFAIMEHNH